MADQLTARIRILEERSTFQEQTIDALNEVIIDQQGRLARLEEELRHLRELLDGALTESPTNLPPPHY